MLATGGTDESGCNVTVFFSGNVIIITGHPKGGTHMYPILSPHICILWSNVNLMRKIQEKSGNHQSQCVCKV